MPISAKAKKKVLAHLPILKPKNPIFELGSGWGGMAFSLAKHYNNNSVIAIERSFIPYIWSQIFYRRHNLIFLRKDFTQVSLENSELVFCYLFSKAMIALEEKFQNELPPNSYVISHVFSLPTWKAETILEVHDLYQSRIFYYRNASSKALSTNSTVFSFPKVPSIVVNFPFFL